MLDVIHFYKSKNYRRRAFRILCTGALVDAPDVGQSYSHTMFPRDFSSKFFTTSFNRVSCPDCIQILVAKREKEIETMKQKIDPNYRTKEKRDLVDGTGKVVGQVEV